MTAAPAEPPPTNRATRYHRESVLAAVRAAQAVSRVELARSTGLSRATVSAIVAELQTAGILKELPASPHTQRGSGRPGRLLAFAQTAGIVVGIDFGHSHVRAALASLSGEVLAEQHLALDVGASAERALDAAADLVSALLTEARLERGLARAAVLGLPAPIHRATGRVMVGNILPGWIDRTPAAELQERLGIPVRVDNDANLSALGEQRYGGARGLRDVLFLKVSSGIGAGLVLNGRIHRGALGIAGEIGHIPVDVDGALCRCGNRGCLETLVSMSALRGMLQTRSSETLTVARIDELAETDQVVRRVLTDAGRTIGRVVAELAQSLNPTAVVIGGDMDHGAGLIAQGVRESIDRYTHLAVAEAVTVMVSALGSRAAVLGAIGAALDASPLGDLLAAREESVDA
ncbi:ROK family transcriptional regulator [Actinospica durhamensis]|uniref:ROK family transcriptional regulator n=1 Tax=Actinospica durhamensis TaxID=1508375 RepID=A0A941ELD3_9ACTN|nr:ROK family transcriptional regulator [Actinospica durhamensis]MBR7833461.1 ROK family transcriptional regulator [Actinospica durhamensis]